MDIASQFRAAIAATGLTPPDDLSPGTKIRFPGLNKPPKSKDAWCFLFEDGLGGVFGDYSSGIDSVWQASSARNFTESERQAFEQKVRATRLERERQQAIDKARAATLAKRRWEEASPCQYSQYLEAKGVRSYCLREEADGGLLVPITKSDGEIVSLQTVEPKAEELADRLVRRDRESDDRRTCFECSHLKGFNRLRCDNWKVARISSTEEGALRNKDDCMMLQRCDGFSNVFEATRR